MIKNQMLREAIKQIDPTITKVYDGVIPYNVDSGVAIKETRQESKNLSTFDNSLTEFMVEVLGDNNLETRERAERLFLELKSLHIWTQNKRETVSEQQLYINFTATIYKNKEE